MQAVHPYGGDHRIGIVRFLQVYVGAFLQRGDGDGARHIAALGDDSLPVVVVHGGVTVLVGFIRGGARHHGTLAHPVVRQQGVAVLSVLLHRQRQLLQRRVSAAAQPAVVMALRADQHIIVAVDGDFLGVLSLRTVIIYVLYLMAVCMVERAVPNIDQRQRQLNGFQIAAFNKCAAMDILHALGDRKILYVCHAEAMPGDIGRTGGNIDRFQGGTEEAAVAQMRQTVREINAGQARA